MVRLKQDDAESWRRAIQLRLMDTPIHPMSFLLEDESMDYSSCRCDPSQ